MMIFLLGVFATIIISSYQGVEAQGYKRVCYTLNWSQYKNGAGRFLPEYIDPSLCTHIIYAFGKIQNNHLAPVEWNDESTPWMKGMYARFMEVKKKNPAIKTLLAIGGWNIASGPFSAVVSNPQSRAEFITQSIKYLRKHNFDGIDIDWEYPTLRGGQPADRHSLTVWLQEMKQAYENEARTTGQSRLLITAAVAAGEDKLTVAYEIPQISQILDFINVMSYDLHGAWDKTTGHNAPLYARSAETGRDRYLNVDWVAKKWVQMGAPKNKLIIGVPMFGRTFTLRSASNSAVGAPAARAGRAGRLTMEAGYLAYYEVCDALKKGAQRHWITEQQVPYAVQGDQWIGYDDETSLRLKVDYIKSSGYGGVMLWALDQDDFSGSCGQGKFPLIRAINDQLRSASVVRTTPNPIGTQTQSIRTQRPTLPPRPTTPRWTLGPVITNPPIRTTQPPIGTAGPRPQTATVFCSNKFNGFYASPTSCQQYYICAQQRGFQVTCPFGLHYNPTQHFCDYPANVACQSSATARPNPTTPQPTTPAPATAVPTTPAPASVFCLFKSRGIYRDPTSCTHYYLCDYGLTFRQACIPGKVFNYRVNACDFRSRVPGC